MPKYFSEILIRSKSSHIYIYLYIIFRRSEDSLRFIHFGLENSLGARGGSSSGNLGGLSEGLSGEQWDAQVRRTYKL